MNIIFALSAECWLNMCSQRAELSVEKTLMSVVHKNLHDELTPGDPRLLHEAYLQRTIDKLKNGLDVSDEPLEETQNEVERDGKKHAPPKEEAEAKQQRLILKVKKLADDAVLPQYAHAGDAGLDLFSNEHAEIGPGQSRLVKTGISIELPENSEAQIRPRSGLALKHQITVLNAPGTIDGGYRGEVGVILINHGRGTFVVEKGMKVAQMIVTPVIDVEIEEVDDLSDTQRGTGGFGSTSN